MAVLDSRPNSRLECPTVLNVGRKPSARASGAYGSVFANTLRIGVRTGVTIVSGADGPKAGIASLPTLNWTQKPPRTPQAAVRSTIASKPISPASAPRTDGDPRNRAQASLPTGQP